MRIMYVLPLALLLTATINPSASHAGDISISIGNDHHGPHYKYKKYRRHYKHHNHRYNRGSHYGWHKNHHRKYRNNRVIYRSAPIIHRTYVSTNYYVPNYPPNFVYANLPYREYMTDSGRYCREYQSQAVIAGRPQETYGQACLQPDGSWEIIH